ncbi:MAG: ABC transporter permease, partial [Flavobacteriales bacterium]
SSDHPETKQINDLKMIKGRFLNELDIQNNRKIAVIGKRVRDVLFDKGEKVIGESIRINKVYFKIVGLFWSERSGHQNDNNKVYIPFSTFQKAFGKGDKVGWISFIAKDDYSAVNLEKKALKLLKKRHKVHPDDVRAFGHFNLAKMYNKINILFTGMNFIIWIVGIGTLAAGVVGVSNIMLVIIKERTKEIGIRRAIGASPWSIISQILTESIILTFIAGYLGLFLGVFILETGAIQNVITWVNNEPAQMFQNPGLEIKIALKALCILLFSGVLAGMIPASRAVKIKPVEAIREN